MVGNSATRLACEFQRTEWRRHVSEHETTGTKKHPKPLQNKCGYWGWGLDVEKIFLPFRRGGVFFT
jgi:hypothetical protein